MSLSDDDLALIGAYHDGELDAETAAHVAARLTDDAELREALAGIQEISAALSALSPTEAHKRPDRAAPFRPWAVLAAASLAAVVVIGSLLFAFAPSSPKTPLDWHQHFLAQTYLEGGELKPLPVTKWVGDGPDLSVANLTLVDIAREGDANVFLHYSGVNGCRLTFAVQDGAPELPPSSSSLLSDLWSDGDLYYSVLAIGMDEGRFHAVTKLLRERTRLERMDDNMFVAVRRATERAVPCA